ncbi:MAG: type 1 periplasmic binding fold superfamily protein [Flavobacteriales bacterium]|nr:type 1 periplasmic binding fold superfamily protein [Flavobacteriales bacterium]
MKRASNPIILALLAIAALVACKKENDDHQHDTNEEELITTVELHFHQVGGGEHKHFTWRDIDGDGGNPPVIVADTLTPGMSYEVSMELLNESVSPTDSITSELQAEAAEHQFFFQVAGADVMVTYNDTDGNGDPLGLVTIWTVGAASSGTIVVTLRHEPDKGAPGVSSGDITNAGGETDIATEFPLVVE